MIHRLRNGKSVRDAATKSMVAFYYASPRLVSDVTRARATIDHLFCRENMQIPQMTRGFKGTARYRGEEYEFVRDSRVKETGGGG